MAHPAVRHPAVSHCAPTLALLSALCGTTPAPAAGLDVHVTAAGAPLDDVVIAVHGGVLDVHAPRTHVVDQVDKQFAPRIAAIRVGDSVRFPNSDDIRHHVYSFSPAKSFELPLYHGMPTQPVVFERPGKVVLGCNIHDRMAAWVYVLDAPRFALSAHGTARFAALPPGRYEVALWHPHQRAGDEGVRHVIELDDADRVVTFELVLTPPPALPASALSPLEAKFRALREAARTGSAQ
ncbi:MAG: methylamine utilization protein [Gammaproteobacteria bacterium]